MGSKSQRLRQVQRWTPLIALSFAWGLEAAPLGAQDPTDSSSSDPASRWELVGFPYVNFGSDEGVGYGVIGGAYLVGGEIGSPESGARRAYRLAVEPTVFLTTEGRRDLTVFLDAPGLLSPGWRVDAALGLERHLAVPYYGVGNDTPHLSELEDGEHPSFYRFGRNRMSLRVNVQRAIPGTPLRALVGMEAGSTTVDPRPREGGTTLLAEELGTLEELPGLDTRSGRVGLVWDSRDHEVVPRRGTWTEVVVQQQSRSLGGDLDFTRWSMVDRRYFPLTEALTFANRLLLQWVRGDPPPHELMRIQSSFKEQEGLGGAASVRGLPQNRYVGRGLVLWNAELRWEGAELRVLSVGFRPGLVAFFDSGRVWEEGVRGSELVREHHRGAGAGLRLRLGESFVVSADLGRSSGHPVGFYLGVGHRF